MDRQTDRTPIASTALATALAMPALRHALKIIEKLQLAVYWVPFPQI